MPLIQDVFRLSSILFILIKLSSSQYTVNIENLGSVEGVVGVSSWTNRPIYSFYNVPYGQSPSKTGRFKPPEKVLPWEGTYNATSPRRVCPQIAIIPQLINQTTDEDLEDCLTLNIFTPQLPTKNSKLLPVMVYLHGGGFYEGSALYFPPNYILEKDVILIVPQYRIAPFGTLCLDVDEAPGNALFFDQILALEWINQHIGNFAGDSKQITVFGQSAGATTIDLLLISPIVDSSLFSKAILQSGSALNNWAISNNPIDSASALYYQITQSQNATVSTMLQTFESVSVLGLLYGFYNTDYTKSGAVVQKAGTKKLITKSPDYYVKNGLYKTVPMVIGVVKNDGSYGTMVLYDYLEKYGVQNNVQYLKQNLTSDLVAKCGIDDNSGTVNDIFEEKFFKNIFDKHENISFQDVAPGVTDLAGAISFKAPAVKTAKANADLNTTYLYTFDYYGEHTRFGYGINTTKYPFDGGVHHSNDLLYLFPYHYPLPLNEKDTKVAKIMVDLWTSFAIDSKPSSPFVEIDWPQMKRGENGPYLHITTSSFLGDDFVKNEYDVTIREDIFPRNIANISNVPNIYIYIFLIFLVRNIYS